MAQSDRIYHHYGYWDCRWIHIHPNRYVIMRIDDQYSQHERELKRKQQVRRRQRKKKRMKGLDKYVIFCFVVLIIYTAAQTIVTINTGVESSTLTTCFFGVFGGEVLLCALIKRLKLKNEPKESEDNDL